MTYMEMNPYWHVPPKIAGRDILPHIQRDIQYLARKKIRVFQSWRTGAPEIRPEHVEWSEITARSLSFKLLQEPGPENALGRVKFMFPNKFNVYLHDTPARELFKKTKRAFSSGCIRVERPIDLAVHLLQNKFEWARENLRAVVDSGLTEVIRLPEPMPVHLLYWTTWADQDGTIHFREDIYERDKQLEKELDRRPPSPAVAWPESPSWSEPNI
jgi:murein L,D-transpeptidase YcbB/YkuD